MTTRHEVAIRYDGPTVPLPGWDRRKLKYVASIEGGCTPSKSNPDYWSGAIPWVSPKDMKVRVIRDSEDHVSEEALRETSLRLIDPPVILIVVRGMILAHTLPVAVTAAPVTINQDMKALRSRFGVSTEYLAYFLEGTAGFVLSTMVEESAHGTKCLRADVWHDLSVLIPTLDEQRAIAAFLDRETSRIDALIEKKRRQFELLHEKRAALISHAVTKGLDPNAPMKDSGLDWLGDIPAHWKMKRLKFASTLQTGLTLGKKYADRALVSRPYLRVANVQDGYLELETITEVELPAKEAERYELQPGDVLMTEGGDFDKLGRGYVWDGQIPSCLHQNHIFAVRPYVRMLNPHFLAAVLTSSHGKNYFTSTSQQTTNLASTNSTKLRNLPVPLPPIAEQAAVVARLTRDARYLDTILGKVTLSIDRLREYRTALTSAAVTGKLDVRQEAVS